ncbi:GcrA family cell cycle regulator [Hirschia maritima]|uniref:GcrA family cell cycle regulator n=1 Tax=Hirschia maritima TaxID=1121961 RepID=UPI0003635A4F|nr:GcrA family cell cycle regulator [Hirschia maritima]
MAWTEERVAELKKLWAEGHSASQIAKQLGGVTRNAVIGKVHRLGLSGRATPSRPVKRPPRLARPKPQVTQPAAASAKPAAAAGSNKRKPAKEAASGNLSPSMAPVANVKPKRLNNGDMVTVMTVSDSMCKWPVGDPTDPDFGFCGHSTDGDSPYCAEHAKLAYQPSRKKRERSATSMYDQARRMAG